MEAAAASTTQSGAFIAKLGAWLQLAQVIGIVGTVMAMMRAFSILKTEGAGDPAKLSEAIGEVLVYTVAGIGPSLIGLALVTIAITACRYRAAWMWRFLCLYGLIVIGLNVCVVWLAGHFAVTLYLPVALFFLIFALVKKGEFQRADHRRPLPACYLLDE